MTVHALLDLPSHNPVEATRSHHRVDPYYGGIFGVSSSAAWLSRKEALRLVASRVGAVQPADREAAMEDCLHGRQRVRRLRAIAAVNMWRTMTTQQVAAMTGHPGFSGRRSKDVHALWSASLISRGRPATIGRGTHPELVRPDVSTDVEALRDELDYRDWLAVTAGVRWRWGSQADRHNVLTTELALRVAEHLPVPLVLGEQLTPLRLVGSPGVTTLDRSSQAADAMLVRSDGMRVMVETTANIRGIEDKAQRWAQALAQDSTRELAVVFVIVTHPDRSEVAGLAKARRVVHEAAHSSMETVFAGVPERMMVVSWRSWFPGPHQASSDFLSLVAYRSDGSESTWRPVSILDPFDLAFPASDERAKAILNNANLLFGVPHWLRTGPGPDVTEVMRATGALPEPPRQAGVKPGSAQRAELKQRALSAAS